MTSAAVSDNGDTAWAGGPVRLPRGLPRITRAVFTDLALWMVGFGVVIGAVFPLFVVALGVNAADALTGSFFAATLVAGVLVGGVNWWLTRMVVGARLRVLSGGMQHVAAVIRHATDTGDWSGCDQDRCRLFLDSDDELGDSARAFNDLIDALGRSQRVEAAIRDLFQALSSHLELEQLADAALGWVAGHVDASAGALFLCRDGMLRPAATIGSGDLACLGSDSELQAVLRDRVPRAFGDPTTAGATPVWMVPIFFTGTPLGVIVLAGRDVLSADSTRILDLFSRAVAVSIVNAQTHARSQQLALLDPLTGCANRRSGLTRLEEALTAADRAGTGVGVLMIDLDHFKAVNDTYGHLAGDRVLVHAARTISGCLRGIDTLVRYGGEEFLAVLPGADEDDLAAAGARICRALQHSPLDAGGLEISVTASIGVARHLDADAGTAEQLLERADQAMYRAKAAGRNRVVSADPATT